MVSASARSPTISCTGSPGATYRRRKTTTSTPASVGMARRTRRRRKLGKNGCWVLVVTADRERLDAALGVRLRALRSGDLHVRPALTVEDRRDFEVADPGLHGVEVIVEEEGHHGRVRVGERVGGAVERCALRIVLFAPSGQDELVERRVGVERHVTARAFAAGVQERIEEAVGVGIVGVPGLERHVGLALARCLTRGRRITLYELRADARRVQVSLDRLR